ncbi:hypothetical protein ACFQZI_09835 [Mucilaginibacter lutimaris]|uniref:Outer membrane protein beta-barrel domain-containing protein n=1 Tax=Mucilaginibacter lutimaris TaxID=931629 RepID=A0ABW2ZG95_9SPHI
MIKLLTKTLFFTLLLSAITSITKAQIGYDYAQYDIGFGGTINQVYGDAEGKVKSTPSVFVNFNYNQTPYLNYLVEIQTGKLEGGSRTETLSGRYFKNNFTAIVFRGQLQAGELMDYSNGGIAGALKGLYVSAGLGYILNDIHDDNINRYSNTDPQFFTGGLNKSNELYLPVRLGYEIKFFNQYNQPSFKIDLAYQFNNDFTDNMDGFTAGRNKDKLVQYSIGLKFALGDVTSYRKSVQ